MTKTFKKFREDWDDDWSSSDEEHRTKDSKMKERRDQRRKKVNEKLSQFSEDIDDE